MQALASAIQHENSRALCLNEQALLHSSKSLCAKTGGESGSPSGCEVLPVFSWVQQFQIISSLLNLVKLGGYWYAKKSPL